MLSNVKPHPLHSGWETPEGLTTVIAGEIKEFDPEGYISKKMARRLDPYISYMIVAAKKALEAGGILHDNEEQLAKLDRARCGCLIGSAMGGMHSFSTATENLIKVGHRKMNPFCIPFAITNMGSALTAMDLKFMGPNYSISSVGRCKLDPALKAPGFKTLMVKNMTVLST